MPPPSGTLNPLEGPGDYTMTKIVHSDTYPAINPASLPRRLLANRAVFVVGASRGIGKATALSYARAGASFIAIGARSSISLEPVERQMKAVGLDGLKVLCVEVEVSDAKSVEAAAKAVEIAFGRLDIVVQNAGIFGTTKKIVEDDVEDWWKVWEVNVKGQFLLAKYFLPLMLETEGGLKTFVTVASVGAHLIGPGCSQYQTAKLANLRMAEFIDAEYREQGVSAWCVHPGNVVTELALSLDTIEHLKDIFVDTPEIAADTISYLTAEKRQWLSGRYINVTWDMPELLAQKDQIVKGDKLKVRLVL